VARDWSEAEIVSTVKNNKMSAKKLNNTNGLQDWKTEHQAVTSYIKHLAVSALLGV